MFTGIIESTGTVKNIISEDTNKHFVIEADIASELKIDQSVSHNGVCLTVVAVNNYQYTVTAIEETLKRTNLNELTIGSTINLERCMPANGRFDGHIVQGHVDDTAQCVSIEDYKGSWLFTFQLKNNQYNNLIVDKGSICINGISLTVVECKANQFSVAVIPYTYTHTNLHKIKPKDNVNIELDIVGKYIAKMLSK